MGRSDALIDIALASTALVHALQLSWEYPARAVLVLYSGEGAGEEWELGGMHVGSSAADIASQVALTTACDQRAKGSERCASPHGSTSGVLARRLRVLLANATTLSSAGLPLLGLRSLSLDACDYPRATVTAAAQLVRV